MFNLQSILQNGRMIVIEMNPRVSRSSALASKATGFPIAKVAAKLAIGYTLDEITNDITGNTPASFEPTIDYVVTKIPRFAFEKFQKSKGILGTAMKSVGEAMAIGRNFKESLQKALVSLEVGLEGLDEIAISKEELEKRLEENIPQKIQYVAQAFRMNFNFDVIYQKTNIDPWFLNQIKEIIDIEKQITEKNIFENKNFLNYVKASGFSDKKISDIIKKPVSDIITKRNELGIVPVYKKVDTCAAEFNSVTPYMYSTYDVGYSGNRECESNPTEKEKVVIIGGGPNRIGQGIEFDYCCCQASYALSEIGYETIMINCNPETVSTDYDTSDRLYFEPLIEEYVLEILKKENSKGKLKGVIVQFGGQTPLKLAKAIHDNNYPILGTPLDSIDLTEDRERFSNLINQLNLKQAENGLARSKEEAFEIAKKINFPFVIRPSYVLGGRAMEIIHDDEQLKPI